MLTSLALGGVFAAVAVASPVEDLPGKWGWVAREGAENLHTCTTNPHSIRFSPDLSLMSVEFAKPLSDSYGTTVVQYRVLSVGERSLMLDMVPGKGGQTQEGGTLWELVILANGNYVWRRPEWSPTQSTSPVERCEIQTMGLE
jgi:hypothetical protein